jgi:hypothetical protein
MATVTEPIPHANDQATTPRRETAPRAPAGQPEVYWADWLTLRVWFAAFVLMWGLQLLDFLTGLWRR